MNTTNQLQLLWMRNTARVIISVWCGFWLYFAIASSISEKMFADVLFVGIPVLILFLLPWKWEKTGGLVLLIAGLTIFFGFPFLMGGHRFWFNFVTGAMLGIIPIIAGTIFTIRQIKIQEIIKNESNISETIYNQEQES